VSLPRLAKPEPIQGTAHARIAVGGVLLVWALAIAIEVVVWGSTNWAGLAGGLGSMALIWLAVAWLIRRLPD
jgi:hypothetical protein